MSSESRKSRSECEDEEGTVLMADALASAPGKLLHVRGAYWAESVSLYMIVGMT